MPQIEPYRPNPKREPLTVSFVDIQQAHADFADKGCRVCGGTAHNSGGVRIYCSKDCHHARVDLAREEG